MYSGGAFCEQFAVQLGNGKSTVNVAVTAVSKAIYTKMGSKVHLPETEQDLAFVMKGFEKIRGFPTALRPSMRQPLNGSDFQKNNITNTGATRAIPASTFLFLLLRIAVLLFADVGQPGFLSVTLLFTYLQS